MVHVVALWLNYNSSKAWDVVKESLHSVLNLERGNFDLTILVIDGGSTDNSPDLIRKYINEAEAKNRVVIYRLIENKGYAGNMNSGYEYAVNNLGADYVVFLNNDIIVQVDSLRRLFEWIKKEDYVGIQGLELRPDGSIGNAGAFHDEFGRVMLSCTGYSINECEIDKPYFVTYPSGAYALYSVDFISDLPGRQPFITETFMYFDDNYLGLMAWQKSQKVAYVPVIAGVHHGSLTIKSAHGKKAKDASLYIIMRSKTALWENIKCKHQKLFKLYKSRIYLMAKLGLLNENVRRGIFDGFKLAEVVREKIAIIDLEKAVHLEFPTSYYVGQSMIPGFGSIYRAVVKHSTHIRRLRKYIRYPDWLGLTK